MTISYCFPLKKTLGKMKQAEGVGRERSGKNTCGKNTLGKNSSLTLAMYLHITEKGTFHFSIWDKIPTHLDPDWQTSVAISNETPWRFKVIPKIKDLGLRLSKQQQTWRWFISLTHCPQSSFLLGCFFSSLKLQGSNKSLKTWSFELRLTKRKLLTARQTNKKIKSHLEEYN